MLPIMAIRDQGSYLPGVLEVHSIYRIVLNQVRPFYHHFVKCKLSFEAGFSYESELNYVDEIR
jgi:hypothetical protein